MAWQVIEVPVPTGVGEIVADSFRNNGANGVSEEWRKGKDYVKAFWHEANPDEVEATTKIVLGKMVEFDILPADTGYTFTEMEDQDWLEGWKQFFSPVSLTDRIAVMPSWETYDALPGQQVIILDPGMAFGTGTHGTTYNCLLAVSDYVQPGLSFCDIGTGSGILAIAAAKLGASPIVGTDNDALAVKVATNNAVVNKVDDQIKFTTADLTTGIDGKFDITIANILAPVILELIPYLPGVMKPGGIFISSGYITSQEEKIAAALVAAGHTMIKRYEREDWVTLVSRS
jgi:ribosomal protein L11 methyltransferase